MKLSEIKKLNEAPTDVSFNYGGEIDPKIGNIEGHPYSMYVNEADPKLKNSITFLVGSDDDDGVSWEVDLGEPQGTSTSYEQPSDHGPGGHEVDWQRNSPQHDEVLVDDMTNNQSLKQMIPHITTQLKSIHQTGNIEQAHDLFTQVLQHINRQQ